MVLRGSGAVPDVQVPWGIGRVVAASGGFRVGGYGWCPCRGHGDEFGPALGVKHDGILREGEMRPVECKGVVRPLDCSPSSPRGHDGAGQLAVAKNSFIM